MKTEKLIMRIDPERKGFLETKAKKEDRPLSAVVTEALDLFQAYSVIEKHMRESLLRNIKEFGDDFNGFCKWIADSKDDRWSHYANPFAQQSLHKAVDTLDSIVSQETFSLLRQWHDRKPEERDQFMRDSVMRCELWIPPYFLNDSLPFADDEATENTRPIKAEAVA